MACTVITDKTPSLQEMFGKDYSASKSVDGDDQDRLYSEADKKPVFIAA